MNKELEALENIKHYDSRVGLHEDDYKVIETALKRIDYLERVNKDLQESKGKLIEERNNKIIEHRAVYDDYNFQSIKKFVACKDCQYYQNEKCMNKDDCFWLDLERKLKALEIITSISKQTIHFRLIQRNMGNDKFNYYLAIDNCEYRLKDKEEYDLLKEVLL